LKDRLGNPAVLRPFSEARTLRRLRIRFSRISGSISSCRLAASAKNSGSLKALRTPKVALRELGLKDSLEGV
jgi:hypothetical protein